MITSVSNPQMKRIKELLNKSKQRRKEKCFVAEGIRMVAETPADRLERVYVSESFYRHPPELRGLDLSKALIVDDQVFVAVALCVPVVWERYKLRSSYTKGDEADA